MEQSLKKTAVHMYGVYITPVAFALHPRWSDSRSGMPLSEWNARHIAFAHTCGTAIENRP